MRNNKNGFFNLKKYFIQSVINLWVHIILTHSFQLPRDLLSFSETTQDLFDEYYPQNIAWTDVQECLVNRTVVMSSTLLLLRFREWVSFPEVERRHGEKSL